MNARDEINNLLTYINTRLEKNNDVDRDFVLRSGLVLSELEYGFKVENFTRENLGLIEVNWGKIKQAIEKAFRTINLFGVDAHDLTSLNAAMPIAYYFYRVDDLGFASDLIDSDNNLERIRRWLASALLNGIFGGTANVTVGLSRSIIRSETLTTHFFPSKMLVSQMTKRGRIAEFDDEAIEKFLGMNYRKTLGFIALSLIYDRHDWSNERFQKENIFPPEFSDEIRLISMDTPTHELQASVDAWDRIPNMILLSPDEHIEKSEMSFNEWALSREDEFFDRHLMPKNRELYLPRNFMGFIRAREEMIAERLRTLFDFGDVTLIDAPMEEQEVC